MSDVPHKKAKNKSAWAAGGEEFSTDNEGKDAQSLEPGRLSMNALQKAQALGKHTAEEAQAIADEYGKSLGEPMHLLRLSYTAT